MQKKNDNFLEKIVKKDYNNELEKVLEKKYFEENVKSILLSILYKIETAYKDYKQVKQNVEPKEEFVQNFINMIDKNCNEIKLINPNSQESKMIGKKTFLIEKSKKRIICYNVERKLLYCISKIAKKDKIIKDDYFIINETLSNLINVGNNINTVEPLRDFNGYSWTSIPREIESIEHNLIYQNLIMLVGNQFINSWVENKEFIIDYMELFKNKMEKEYGKENADEFMENLKKISVLLEAKYDKKKKQKLIELKNNIETEIENINDSKKFVEKITKEKRNLTNEIRKIDETINNKSMLQEEYIKRNEYLPLEEKIFSIRILSKLMTEEREKKIIKLEKLNDLLNPQKFVDYKKELENKEKYLKLLDTTQLDKDISKLKLELQKTFLKCFEIKLKKHETKQEILKLIYEFRYYTILPYDYNKNVGEILELSQRRDEVGRKIIKQANDIKVIEKLSKQEEINYAMLKNIFKTRSINLENINIKLTKENDKYYIQIFDENSLEEKYEIGDNKNINKKELALRINKKVKIFL